MSIHHTQIIEIAPISDKIFKIFLSSLKKIDNFPTPQFKKTNIIVLPSDSISTAKRLFEQNDDASILILNMIDENMSDSSSGKTYFLYSPKVTVFKDENYELIDDPFEVSYLNFAANFKSMKTTKNGKERFASDDDKQLMKDKIQGIFHLAILYNHTYIIFNTFGCGLYQNPVDDIVDLFNDALHKYHKYFNHIVFAIKSYKDHNYEIFRNNILTNFPD